MPIIAVVATLIRYLEMADMDVSRVQTLKYNEVSAASKLRPHTVCLGLNGNSPRAIRRRKEDR